MFKTLSPFTALWSVFWIRIQIHKDPHLILVGCSWIRIRIRNAIRIQEGKYYPQKYKKVIAIIDQILNSGD
jgi:hypothetical protein